MREKISIFSSVSLMALFHFLIYVHIFFLTNFLKANPVGGKVNIGISQISYAYIFKEKRLEKCYTKNIKRGYFSLWNY